MGSDDLSTTDVAEVAEDGAEGAGKAEGSSQRRSLLKGPSRFTLIIQISQNNDSRS